MADVITFSNIQKLLNVIKENSDDEVMKSKITQFQIEMLEYLIEEKKEDIDVEKTSDLEDNLESLSEHLSEKNRYISEICLKKSRPSL